MSQIAASLPLGLPGNCLDVLKGMRDCSMDSIVTDPPYGLSFMGKKWDYDVPGVEIWQECLRVLKPGGHILAFAGSRTYHRMACRIEDAGFEMRDQLLWLYGTGWPKSQDVSKAIDKATGNLSAAQDWNGWGTALKPAHEPIVMARKPFKGTVAANVLEHGTGALNIDASRVSAAESGRWPANVIHDGSEAVVSQFPVTKSGSKNIKRQSGTEFFGNSGTAYGSESRPAGTEMIAYGDEGSAARFFYCAKPTPTERHRGMVNPGPQSKHGTTLRKMENITAQAPQGNHHPTVKPITLMVHLIKLVAPAGGMVLDPFMGTMAVPCWWK